MEVKWDVESWWIAVNIVVAGGGPWLANFVLFLLEHNSAETANKPNVKWDPWNAYRDGQLGFVAVGWAAAALYDVGTHKCMPAFTNPGWVQLALGACIVGGALFAAQGARKPEKQKFVPTRSFPKGLTDRLKFYSIFSLTSFFALLTLISMVIIHFKVLGHECT